MPFRITRDRKLKTPMRQTFSKSERLCSKKVIERLFEKGSATTRTFYLFPFRVLYLRNRLLDTSDLVAISETEIADSETTKSGEVWPAILISISRRNFKKAVDRNLIRRRVREAYRKNKSILLGTTDRPKQPPAYLVFLYTAREKISFEEIEKSMKLALARL